MPKPLDNYSGSIQRTPGSEAHPKSVRELKKAIGDAARPITLRATGNSLHDQALGSGTVIFVDELPHRVVVRTNDRVTSVDGVEVAWNTVEATAWTPWDVIVRAGLRLGEPARWHLSGPGHWDVSGAGEPAPPDRRNVCRWEAAQDPLPLLVPYVLPSSGRITVGGSLSGDTMWRFSSLFGKESRSVVWLDLLRVRPETESGFEVLRLLNAEAGLFEHRVMHASDDVIFAADASENDALFHAVIGGFGALGPIIGAKYVLLELDPALTHDAFVLSPPSAPQPAILPEDQVAEPLDAGQLLSLLAADSVFGELEGPSIGVLETLLAEPDEDTLEASGVQWPSYPHSPKEDLGQLGATLGSQALTWMWRTSGEITLLETLLDHQRAHQAAYAGLPMQLPKKVDKSTVACFALVFPSYGSFRAVVGNVAFGKEGPGAPRFKMWDREYGRKNLPRVLAALPGLGWVGERVVYWTMFAPCIRDTRRDPSEPRSNPLPEFGLFMEGHSVALSAMDEKPMTLQQTWVLPALDANGDIQSGLFVEFMAAVRRLSRQLWLHPEAIRVQICDVKVVPQGHALLSSCPEGPAVAVTLAVEDGRAYEENGFGWGDPKAVFRTLSKTFRDRGVRVHLTKNLHVEKRDLAVMYGDALRGLRTLKQQIDPEGIWGSHFFESTLP